MGFAAGLGTLVGKKDRRAFYPDLCMADFPVWHRKSHGLLSGERLLLEVHSVGGATDHQVRDGGSGVCRILGHCSSVIVHRRTLDTRSTIHARTTKATHNLFAMCPFLVP